MGNHRSVRIVAVLSCAIMILSSSPYVEIHLSERRMFLEAQFSAETGSLSSSAQMINAPSFTPIGGPSLAPTVNLIVQNGNVLTKRNGVAVTYNLTKAVQLSDLYADRYNYYQGYSNSFEKLPHATVTENYSGNKYRALLRFDGLERFIPSSARILQATLTIPIEYTWSPPASIQACIMSKYWDTKPRGNYKGIGWGCRMFNSSFVIPNCAATSTCCGGPTWTVPGGWLDCDPRFNMTATLSNVYQRASNVAVNIDPGVVSSWIRSANNKNYGVFIRAIGGSISITTSFTNSTIIKKGPVGPSLAVQYEYTSELSGPPSSFPTSSPTTMPTSPPSEGPSLMPQVARGAPVSAPSLSRVAPTGKPMQGDTTPTGKGIVTKRPHRHQFVSRSPSFGPHKKTKRIYNEKA